MFSLLRSLINRFRAEPQNNGAAVSLETQSSGPSGQPAHGLSDRSDLETESRNTLPAADEEADDVQARFAAWEEERKADLLQRVAHFQEHGLRLLTKATLLRQGLRCEEEGANSLAYEIYQLAEPFNGRSPGAEATTVPEDCFSALAEVPAHRVL